MFVSFGESCSSRGCDKPDFLACLRRFVSRRGKVYSDHGTNLVGARISLFLLTRDLPNKPLLTIALVESSGIFSQRDLLILPASGKLQEDYFKKTAGSYRLTYEELSTVLCQIEANH